MRTEDLTFQDTDLPIALRAATAELAGFDAFAPAFAQAFALSADIVIVSESEARG